MVYILGINLQVILPSCLGILESRTRVTVGKLPVAIIEKETTTTTTTAKKEREQLIVREQKKKGETLYNDSISINMIRSPQ